MLQNEFVTMKTHNFTTKKLGFFWQKVLQSLFFLLCKMKSYDIAKFLTLQQRFKVVILSVLQKLIFYGKKVVSSIHNFVKFAKKFHKTIFVEIRVSVIQNSQFCKNFRFLSKISDFNTKMCFLQ